MLQNQNRFQLTYKEQAYLIVKKKKKFENCKIKKKREKIFRKKSNSNITWILM